MLLMQSLTYDLTRGGEQDALQCPSETEEAACISHPSAFYSGSMCSWSPTDQTCTYIQPDNSLTELFSSLQYSQHWLVHLWHWPLIGYFSIFCLSLRDPLELYQMVV